eukprot:6459535-Amphidinium_carterae.1
MPQHRPKCSSSYQAPMSTSERKTAIPTVVEQTSSASAVREDPQPPRLVDDGSSDIIVARWLKSHGIRSSLIRELHAVHPLPIEVLGDLGEDTTVAAAQEEVTAIEESPPRETAFEEEVIFEGEEDKEPKLSSDDVQNVLAEAQEEVRLEREEESKKRQKE